MIINAAACLIGILSLVGLKRPVKRKWAWCNDLRFFTGSFAVILFGTVSAVLMCFYLFEVQNQSTSLTIYPGWFLTCNGLYLGLGAAVIVFHWRRTQKSDKVKPEAKLIRSNYHTTAMLWVMCPLMILMNMHALLLWVAAAGMNFE